MKKRNVVAILLVTIMIMMLTAGCSTEEISYYRISNELADWQGTEAIRSNGEISVSLNTLSDELVGDIDDEIIDEAFADINSHKLIYEMESDVEADLMTCSIYMDDLDTGDVYPVLTVKREDDVTYVKVDDYIDVIKLVANEFADEEMMAEIEEELDAMFGDVAYISVSDEEIYDYYYSILEGSGMDSEETELMFEELKEQSANTELQNQKRILANEFMDMLIEDVYQDLSLDIIEKEGQKYVLTLDADNFGDTIYNYGVYSIENSDALFATVKGFVESLSEEEFALLVGMYATEEINQSVLAEEIDVVAAEFAAEKDMYLEELDSYLEMYNTMYKAYIEGSVLKHSLEKDDDVITSEFYFEANVNDPEESTVLVNASLTVKNEWEKIDSVVVDAPTENVKTLMEFIDDMPKTMSIETRSGFYMMSNGIDYDYGYMNIVFQDDRSYLPMRMIGETFGETIMWDATLEKPYFVHDGETIYVDEFILVDSTSYIKTREFEKIGYTIEWDGLTETITIINK